MCDWGEGSSRKSFPAMLFFPPSDSGPMWFWQTERGISCWKNLRNSQFFKLVFPVVTRWTSSPLNYAYHPPAFTLFLQFTEVLHWNALFLRPCSSLERLSWPIYLRFLWENRERESECRKAWWTGCSYSLCLELWDTAGSHPSPTLACKPIFAWLVSPCNR